MTAATGMDGVRYSYGFNAPVVDAKAQWANGLPINGTRSMFDGMLIPTGQDSELDDAAHDAGLEPLVIKHTNGTQEHWPFPRVEAMLIAAGLPQKGEPASKRMGIAYGGAEVVVDRKNGAKRYVSRLAARMLLVPLLTVGYTKPIMFTVKSTYTLDFLRLAQDHTRVLSAVADSRQRRGLPEVNYPVFAFAMVFGPSDKPATRGTGNTAKDVIYPMSLVPKNPIPNAYLSDVFIKDQSWIDSAESYMKRTISWSRELSAQFNNGMGEEQEEHEAAAPEPTF